MTPSDRRPQNPKLLWSGMGILAAVVGAVWQTTGSSNALWVCWLGIFAVFETHGLVTETPGDTFSERIHTWFQLKTKAGRAGFFVTIGTLFAWLSWHFITIQPL